MPSIKSPIPQTAPRSPGKKILLHGGTVGKKPILSFFTGTAPRSPGKKILLHGGTVGKKPILSFFTGTAPQT